MEREELVRQIAALEASMEQLPYSVKLMLRSSLEKLQWQLWEIDEAAKREVSTTIDVAEDAIDIPSHLTLGQIEYYLTNAGLSLEDAQGKTYAEVREMVFQAGQFYPPLSSMVRVTLEERERELARAQERTQAIIDETGVDPYDAAVAKLDEAYGHDLDLIGRMISDAEYTIRIHLVEPVMGVLGETIAGAMGAVLEKSMGMPFADGLPIGESMAAQAPEVVKPGSPKIRAQYEKAERAVVEELDTRAKGLIEDLTKAHSPMSPDEAAIAAGTMGAGSIAGFIGLAAAGAAIEGATLGQMEIPGHFLLRIGAMYGLARMAGAVVSVPYKWGVDIGHNYKWASVFQPMIPGMTDLVRMEVREVWRKEFRAEQLEETPSEDFKIYAAYQGFSGEHADSYWAAHWELPTTHQAYEMFHRLRPGRDPTGLEFTRDDLYKLMRRRDVLKRYRDPLIAIAYEVPTRREIRMMVNAGTLSRDDAEEMYLDRGVDPRFAGALADFAWARAQRDPYRERFISSVIRHAKEGYFTRGDFEERLRERNVPDSMIEDAWGLAELDYEYDYKTDLLREIREKLHKKKITMDEFIVELARIVPVPERSRTIVERERAKIKLEAS